MSRLALLLALALVGCDEGTLTGPCLLGDVTGDGVVDVIDAQQVARWSAGLDVDFAIGEPGC